MFGRDIHNDNYKNTTLPDMKASRNHFSNNEFKYVELD